MTIEILRVDAFRDNYLWVGATQDSREAFVVDPGDAAPVIACLEQHGLNLAAILVTHHHPDHTGGIDTLTARYDCAVFGPDSSHIPQVTHKLSEGDHIEVLGRGFHILEVPGHTLDHIAYFSETAGEPPILFCGDTLFAGGCGRLFEGTPGQMLLSLDKLAQLPADTQVYCAHEYTLSNLRFAIAVEPDNSALAARLSEVIEKRQSNLPTVPSSLAAERASNPFLRTRTPAVRSAAESRLTHPPRDEAETFAAIRLWKDNFQG